MTKWSAAMLGFFAFASVFAPERPNIILAVFLAAFFLSMGMIGVERALRSGIAKTPKSGSVHEGAGRNGIAQHRGG